LPGWAERLAFGLLAAAVLAAFGPSLGNGFVGYDDPGYVTRNPHVSAGLTGSGLAWAATAVAQSNWHPLTWASHMLDVTLFGLAPAGHHATSVLLHLANTLLLFHLLRRDTGRLGPSLLVAAVFGVHPLHVESVAWVSERKDVLSTFFWLLALLAWGAYTRRPHAWRYGVVAALFVAALASKPMAVTLPITLLMWDVWPLRRWPAIGARRCLVEKAPLVLLATLSAVITVHAQRAGASLVAAEQLTLGPRLCNAAVSYAVYIYKTLWPSDLAVFYPHPAGGSSSWTAAAAAGLLIAATVLAVRQRHVRPWLSVGWLWYMLTLLPVIGLVQVGLQARADRYMYVPMIGLLIALAWAIDEAAARRAPAGKIAAAASAVLLVALAHATWRQVHVWKDGVTLWRHALAVTEGNFIAHNNLGVELDAVGRHEEALAHYRETLRIKPGDRNGTQNYAMACFGRGERHLAQGDPEAALASFREGLTYRPDNADARAYVGAIEAALRSGTPSRSR
jgi:tetratricopeptide (TPR) repeat protein